MVALALQPAETAVAASPQLDWSDPIDIKGWAWGGGDPVVAVDGDDVWVTWMDGRNGTDVVVRHRSGTSWGNPFTPHSDQATYQGVPCIAADDGVAHLVWMDERDGDRDIYYSHSQVRGWSKELELSDDTASNEAQSLPWIAVEGDDVHVVWSDYKTGRSEVYYRHFDGVRWGDEVILSDETDPDYKGNARIAVDGTIVHVLWTEYSADYTVQYRRATDGSWGPIETVFSQTGADGTGEQLRVDGGVPYALYSADDGTGSRIYIRHRGGLTSWSLPEEVGWDGVAGEQRDPMFDVEAGHIYLAYINRDGLDRYVYTRHYDGTSWSDGLMMHPATPPILFDDAPYIEADAGVVRLVWFYVIDEFRTNFYYTEALADTGRPTSAPTGLAPFWMAEGTSELQWQAHDAYGLRAIHIIYSHSTDLSTWTNLAEWGVVPVSGTDAEGTTKVTPEAREGFYMFQTRAEDLAGHIEAPFLPIARRCAYDTTRPHGALTINRGDEWTSSSTVSLNVTFSDKMTALNWTGPGPVPFMVRFSNDGVWDDVTWAPYLGNASWDLLPGEGNRTVHFQVIDAAGLVSPDTARNISVDLTPPVGVISIEGGTETTRSRNVTLYLNYTDAYSGVSEVRYGHNATWGDEPWEAPATTRNWTLTAGDGTKTVYYQLVDAVGLPSVTYSDTIVLDTTVPQVSQSTPANGSKDFDPEGSVVIQFSEPMDGTSVEDAFNLSLEGGAEVGGTFNWSADGKTLTFTPTEPLEKGKTYHVTVGPGAEDQAGNPPAAVDYTFKTKPKEEDGGLGGVVGLMAAVALTGVAALAGGRRRP